MLDRLLVNLHPFTPLKWNLRLDCEIAAAFDHVTFTYILAGDLHLLELATGGRQGVGQRLDKLWESTCFESFVKIAGEEGYHEVNVSPAGDWNVYMFESYRSGMRREPRVDSLSVVTRLEEDRFVLTYTLPLHAMGLSGNSLKLGVSAVLLDYDASASYWSLAHPGVRPDFHDEAAFLVDI